MLKSLTIGVAAITMTGLPMTAWSRTPDPDAVCFMRTASGQLLHLDRLCANAIVTARPSLNPRVTASRVNFDGQRLKGLLTNQTGQIVRKMTVNYTIVDAQGQELDSGMITQRSPLAPGASIGFERSASHPGASVRIDAVEWSL